MIKKTPGVEPGGKAVDIISNPDLSPNREPLPASYQLSEDEAEYLVAEVIQAAWRIRNSTNPEAIANAKQLFADYGLSVDEAEAIERMGLKAKRHQYRNRRRG
jgi:hypothetical protein